MTKRRVADFGMKKKIDLMLHDTLKKVGAGMVEYLDGWNDDRIAKEVGREIDMELSPATVARLRQDEYGKLRIRTVVATHSPELEARVHALEEVLDKHVVLLFTV